MSTNGIGCDFCEQAHESGVCLPACLGLSEEQVNYMGAFSRQQMNPYSNNFNFGWPSRQIFSWGGNNFQTPQPTKQQHPRKNLEETLGQYMKTAQNHIEAITKNHEETQRNTEASI